MNVYTSYFLFCPVLHFWISLRNVVNVSPVERMWTAAPSLVAKSAPNAYPMRLAGPFIRRFGRQHFVRPNLT